MSKKQILGQFYTTNFKYILQGFDINKIPTNNIIEPFVGKGDLLEILDKDRYNIEMFDIDPKINKTIKQDTLLNPPNYSNKFIITNPPYLARNKNKNKKIYDLYKYNDLYKCFIKSFLNKNCKGGIIIIPLNFLCSIRKNDIELRKIFLKEFTIDRVNIFEEDVFDDTTISICSIFFLQKSNEKYIDIYIYPINKNIKVEMNEDNNYIIGGEIYKLRNDNKYKIGRATKYKKDGITNILLKCIDDNKNNKLGFKIVDENNFFIDETLNSSARSYCSITLNLKLSLQQQIKLVNDMNNFLEDYREKYHSLFLTNYRESNTISRKRISFNLAFKILNYHLQMII